MDTSEQVKLGRKVIFLHPRPSIADGLVRVVAREQYEAFVVADHERLVHVLVLPEFRDAILFIDIDQAMCAEDWVDYVRLLRESPATRGVHVGILSDGTDEKLANRYLMDLGVQGGFIQTGLGEAEMTRVVLSTLQATGARGQRRYVRASCGLAGASVNLKVEDKIIGGVLYDVSVAGMSCILDSDPGLRRNMPLDEIELKLKGSVLTIDGTVAGMRQCNAQRIHAILFSRPKAELLGDRISGLVRECLQTRMARLLDSAGRDRKE